MPPRTIGQEVAEPDEIEAPLWLEDEAPLPQMPPLLPEGAEPSLEPVQMPPYGLPPAETELGPGSPEAAYDLPLVQDDLRPQVPADQADPWTEQSSYRVEGRPRITGTLQESERDAPSPPSRSQQADRARTDRRIREREAESQEEQEERTATRPTRTQTRRSETEVRGGDPGG
jgi:hypothetical protein